MLLSTVMTRIWLLLEWFIVDREYRGLGLGRKVIQTCIDSVLEGTSIMLIATEEGKLLYEKLGFVTVDYVHKYLCDRCIDQEII